MTPVSQAVCNLMNKYHLQLGQARVLEILIDGRIHHPKDLVAKTCLHKFVSVGSIRVQMGRIKRKVPFKVQNMHGVGYFVSAETAQTLREVMFPVERQPEHPETSRE